MHRARLFNPRRLVLSRVLGQTYQGGANLATRSAGLDMVLSPVLGLSGPGGDGLSTHSAGGDGPDRGLL